MQTTYVQNFLHDVTTTIFTRCHNHIKQCSALMLLEYEKLRLNRPQDTKWTWWFSTNCSWTSACKKKM